MGYSEWTHAVGSVSMDSLYVARLSAVAIDKIDDLIIALINFASFN